MPDLYDTRRERFVVRDHLRARLVERGVPVHLHEGLLAYILERREPGQFLRAVLRNDLLDAVMRMSPGSFEVLRAVVLFLFNHVPAPCWGSEARVVAWLADTSVPVVPCD